jgi:hypothetical protein
LNHRGGGHVAVVVGQDEFMCIQDKRTREKTNLLLRFCGHIKLGTKTGSKSPQGTSLGSICDLWHEPCGLDGPGAGNPIDIRDFHAERVDSALARRERLSCNRDQLKAVTELSKVEKGDTHLQFVLRIVQPAYTRWRWRAMPQACGHLVVDQISKTEILQRRAIGGKTDEAARSQRCRE